MSKKATTVFTLEDRYEIRVADNALCFEIFEMREGKDGKMKWQFTQKYPTNLKHACTMVFDMSLKSEGGAIKGLKAMKEFIEDTEKRIINAIETKGLS